MAVNIPRLDESGAIDLNQQPEVIDLMETPVEITSGATTIISELDTISETDPLVVKSVVSNMISSEISTSQSELESKINTKLSKSGDTMTGSLILKGDAVELLEATTLQQVKTLIAEGSINPEDLFKGFISENEPQATPKAANFWYQTSDTEPNTTFPWNVKTWDGTAWSTGTTEYTAEMMDMWTNENANPSEAVMFLGDRWDVINFGGTVFNQNQFVLDEGTLSLKTSGITRDEIAEGQVVKTILGGTVSMTGDEFITWVNTHPNTQISNILDITITSSPTTIGIVYIWQINGFINIHSAFKIATEFSIFNCRGYWNWETTYDGNIADTFSINGGGQMDFNQTSGITPVYPTLNLYNDAIVTVRGGNIDNTYIDQSVLTLYNNTNINGIINGDGGYAVLSKEWSGSITATVSDGIYVIDQTSTHTFDTFARKTSVPQIKPGGTFTMTGDEFVQWCADNSNNTFTSQVVITVTSEPTIIGNLNIKNIKFTNYTSNNGALRINTSAKIATNLTIDSCESSVYIGGTIGGLQVTDSVTVYNCPRVNLQGVAVPNASYGNITIGNGSYIYLWRADINNVSTIYNNCLGVDGSSNILGQTTTTGEGLTILLYTNWYGSFTYLDGFVSANAIIVDHRANHSEDTFVRRNGSNSILSIPDYSKNQYLYLSGGNIATSGWTDILSWVAPGYGYISGRIQSVGTSISSTGVRLFVNGIIGHASGSDNSGSHRSGGYLTTPVIEVKPGDNIVLSAIVSGGAVGGADQSFLCFTPIDLLPANSVMAGAPDYARTSLFIPNQSTVPAEIVAPGDGYIRWAFNITSVPNNCQIYNPTSNCYLATIPKSATGWWVTTTPCKKGDIFRVIDNPPAITSSGFAANFIPFVATVPPTYPMTYPQPGVEQDTGEITFDGKKIYRQVFTGTTVTTATATQTVFTTLATIPGIRLVDSGGYIDALGSGNNGSWNIGFFYVNGTSMFLSCGLSTNTDLGLVALHHTGVQANGQFYNVWIKYTKN